MLKPVSFLALLAWFCCFNVKAVEISGKLEAEQNFYFKMPATSVQHNHHNSVMGRLKFYQGFKNNDYSLHAELFGRADQYDKKRTRGAIRELYLLALGNSFELRMGIAKVHWGVVESQQLVNIINQTDAVEDIENEHKLGQAMVNLKLAQFAGFGSWDFFVLPGFKERTFVGKRGRLRPDFLILDHAQASYQSPKAKHHVDSALRFSHFANNIDFGLAHFYGTSREPLILATSKLVFTPAPSLKITGYRPYYPLIKQTSFDAQTAIGSYLLKLEAVYRSGKLAVNPQTQMPVNDNYFAAAYGFEYSFHNLFDSDKSINLIVEHNYDQRRKKALTLLQNDVLLAARLEFNNPQSSQIQIGIMQDMDYQSSGLNIKASTRIGSSVLLSLKSINYLYAGSNDFFGRQMQQNGFVKIAAAYYF